MPHCIDPRHRILELLAIALTCVAIGTPASAIGHEDRVAQPSLLGDQPTHGLALDLMAPVDGCAVGNADAPVWAIPDFLLPPERYAVVFDPRQECPECLMGLELDGVHLGLQVEGSCEVQLRVFFADVDPSSSLDCRRPGTVLCESPVYTSQLDKPGIWDLLVPLKCPCADRDYEYVIGVIIESASCASGQVPALLADGTPTGCTTFNDFGAGWFDLVGSFGFPGDLALWGETSCCEQPVGVDARSWGAVKSLFD